jgi:hypothetical protein
MTFVGKILVILISIFAVFFLALSTMVFVTEQNWKDRVSALIVERDNIKAETALLKGQVDTQKTQVALAVSDLAAAKQKFATEIKDITDQNNRRQAEITAQRTAVETALEETKKAQGEAQARIDESMVLRKNLETVQNQRDEFKLQKTDLDQTILLQKRELEVAQNNNKNLRESNSVLRTSLRKHNLEDDPKDIVGVTAPPNVEGQVTAVDAANQRVEISVGSNDGLIVGHEFYLYRTEPSPEYLGKIKITSVDVQQSVGRVIGKTLYGKKIQKGDHVSNKISPRG